MKKFSLTYLLKNKLSPEQRATMYDKVNKRCAELGLTTPDKAENQSCKGQYIGGHPLSA